MNVQVRGIARHTYELSYGQRHNKLRIRLTRPTGSAWGFSDGAGYAAFAGIPYATMREAKAAWGGWVVANYMADEGESVPPSTPPTHKPATFPPRHRGYSNFDNACNADPFDPTLRTRSGGALTPLGVLVEIEAWSHRHAADLAAMNGRNNSFQMLMDSVKICLANTLPHKDTADHDSDFATHPAAANESARSTPDTRLAAGIIADESGEYIDLAVSPDPAQPAASQRTDESAAAATGDPENQRQM